MRTPGGQGNRGDPGGRLPAAPPQWGLRVRDRAKCPWRVTLTGPGGWVSLACFIWKGQQASRECSGFTGQ